MSGWRENRTFFPRPEWDRRISRFAGLSAINQTAVWGRVNGEVSCNTKSKSVSEPLGRRRSPVRLCACRDSCSLPFCDGHMSGVRTIALTRLERKCASCFESRTARFHRIAWMGTGKRRSSHRCHSKAKKPSRLHVYYLLTVLVLIPRANRAR